MSIEWKNPGIGVGAEVVREWVEYILIPQVIYLLIFSFLSICDAQFLLVMCLFPIRKGKKPQIWLLEDFSKWAFTCVHVNQVGEKPGLGRQVVPEESMMS